MVAAVFDEARDDEAPDWQAEALSLNHFLAATETGMFLVLSVLSVFWFYVARGGPPDANVAFFLIMFNAFRVGIVARLSQQPALLASPARRPAACLQLLPALFGTLTSGVMFVGCIWCVSSLMRSPTPAGESSAGDEGLGKIGLVVLLLGNNLMFSFLWLMVLLGGLRRPRQRRLRQRHSSSTEQLSDGGIHRRQKPKVTSFALADGMTANTGSLCAICLDDCPSGCLVGRLPCGHLFHAECIREWLKSENARCPMRCRSSSDSSRNDASVERPAILMGSGSHSTILF